MWCSLLTLRYSKIASKLLTIVSEKFSALSHFFFVKLVSGKEK